MSRVVVVKEQAPAMVALCSLCDRAPALLTGDGVHLCQSDFTWAYECVACHLIVQRAEALTWLWRRGAFQGLCATCHADEEE
jgi:hypothetical protein